MKYLHRYDWPARATHEDNELWVLLHMIYYCAWSICIQTFFGMYFASASNNVVYLLKMEVIVSKLNLHNGSAE